MPKLEDDSSDVVRIDNVMREWRQGDIAPYVDWFVHAGDPSVALSEAAAEGTEVGIQALTSSVRGLAVLTQTCDIVRSCLGRPYIECAPLVEVDETYLHEVERGRRPSHAALPALMSERLVVDLDRVMTVEKSIVADWTRRPGWTQDTDARRFAQSLVRKRARFAFPNDFTAFAKRLSSRLSRQHGKGSDEGRGLKALREIRVQARPSWDAPSVTVLFWFVRDEQQTVFEGRDWSDLLEGWLDLVPSTGRFKVVDGLVVTLKGLNGADYVSSDRLDLDHLSSGDEPSS